MWFENAGNLQFIEQSARDLTHQFVLGLVSQAGFTPQSDNQKNRNPEHPVQRTQGADGVAQT